MTRNNLFQICVQIPTGLFWLWLLYRKFVSSKPVPAVLKIPALMFKVCLIPLTCGLFAGCSTADPLAVVSGPLFPLNPGHWQPAPQDLAAPPIVADR